MPVIHAVAAFLSSQLGTALIYLAVVVALDVVAGIVLNIKVFDLRKIKDFVVTTVGFENLAAFVGALGLMYLHHDAYTAAAVAALAGIYATAVLPDLYSKLSTLFFSGKLPLSQNLRASAAKP